MDKIQTVFEQMLSKIEQALVDYHNNPYDPDRAHQVRVPVRKLRALINFFKPLMADEDYDYLNQELKEIGHLYGPMRELDVFIEFISQIALDYPDLSKDYFELFRRLENDRRREMRKTLTESKVKKIHANLDNLRAFLTKNPLNSIEDIDQYIERKLKKKYKKLKKAYKGLSNADYEETHQIRIRAKKVRYAATYLQDLMDQDFSDYRKEAKGIQNKLGTIVDSHVNQVLLEKYRKNIEDQKIRKVIQDIVKIEG